MSSGRRGIDKAKLGPIYERREERGLIIKELKNHASTIPKISEATGLETSRVLQHVVALMQFGRVMVVGQKGINSYTLCLNDREAYHRAHLSREPTCLYAFPCVSILFPWVRCVAVSPLFPVAQLLLRGKFDFSKPHRTFVNTHV
ncbi:MAG: hypothetical protein AOA65_0298 [Candidatus Bathyarchaeota archaeon BA1]|nr:MAG: hypothetical protein AOA65_0298 [Candidatus Bathyarchaeota archaeon BA1]